MGIIIYFVLLMIVPMLAQMNVKSTFNKYSKVRSTSGLTGREVAEEILHEMVFTMLQWKEVKVF